MLPYDTSPLKLVETCFMPYYTVSLQKYFYVLEKNMSSNCWVKGSIFIYYVILSSCIVQIFFFLPDLEHGRTVGHNCPNTSVNSVLFLF